MIIGVRADEATVIKEKVGPCPKRKPVIMNQWIKAGSGAGCARSTV